jgi:hypothetical protein
LGAPEPGKNERGAAGKAKVGVAVETPAEKPGYAAMRLVPKVSRAEIQPLVRKRLATEAVMTAGRAIASWMLPPVSVMSGWFPVRGRRRRRSYPGFTP